MTDKEMLGGIQLEDDMWANCVTIILGLIVWTCGEPEDSLIDDENTYSRQPIDRYNKGETSSTSSSRYLSTATPPSNTLKRKRSFSEGIENRKLKKLSDNLANDMARSLSVLDSTSSSTSTSTPNNIHHPFNNAFLSNRTSPQRTPHLSKAEHQLHQLAQKAGLTVDDYRQRFDQQGHQLQQAMAHLQQMVHQDSAAFDQIKSALHTFLHIVQQVTSDQYALFLDIFPEWRSWDGFIQKMITYIQCIDDMLLLVSEPVKTSDVLHQYIKDVYHLLGSRTKLYGDFLVHNGLEWKAMGLPVNSELLTSVKQWFLRVCLSLLNELDMACSTLQREEHDDPKMNEAKEEEKLMEYILQGLELIGSILDFIGTTNKRIKAHCQILAAVYGQWISEYLEQLNQEQTGFRMAALIKKSSSQQPGKSSSGRTDLRLMQKMEFMVRLLDTLHGIQDLDDMDGPVTSDVPNETRMDDDDDDDDDGAHLETITDMLVEITVRAIAVIETHRSLRSQDIKGTTNIMSKPLQSSYIYMEEALLSFADKVVELSGREWIDGSKVQRLHLFLEDIESSFEEK